VSPTTKSAARRLPVRQGRPSESRGRGLRGKSSPARAVEAARRDRLAQVTADRLIRCRRICIRLRREGREFVSSRELGAILGNRPSLVRKNLSALGRLGTRGCGYRVEGLLRALDEFLGAGTTAAVLVGTGSAGAALLSGGGLARRGFRFVAAFDFDPARAGARCEGLVVSHVSRMRDVLGAAGAEVGVIAVSEAEAEEACRLLAENGMRAILNLTPAILTPREGLVVANFDLASELARLAFYAAGARGRPWNGGATPADRRDGPHAGRRLRGGGFSESSAARPSGREAPAPAGGTGQ
jgi:redox-sensing transcriptional repressor